jgi:hypothetical protein
MTTQQIMPGAASLGGAALLNVIVTETEIMQKNNQLAAANMEVAREQAVTSGNAALDSAKQQGQATMNSSIGQIVGGGLSGLATIGGGISAKYSGAQDQLKEIDVKLGKAQDFNKALTNVDEAGARIGSSGGAAIPQGLARDAAAIRNGSYDFEERFVAPRPNGVPDYSTDSNPEIAMVDRVDRERAYDQSVASIKTLTDQKKVLNDSLSSTTQSYLQYGQLGQTLSQGIGGAVAAGNTQKSGEAEQQKVLANFCLEGLNTAIQKQIDQGQAALQRENAAAQAMAQAGSVDRAG